MPPKVHARLAAELPANAVVAMVAVQDPYDPADRIAVFRSLRDDPLARLRVRNQISETQYQAGRLWQADYEVAEIGSTKGIDTTRDVVDGGRFADLNTDRRLAAAARLKRDRLRLGRLGEIIVTDVLGRGLMITQAVENRGFSDRASLEFYGRLFRESLNTIAEIRGLVSPHHARTRT